MNLVVACQAPLSRDSPGKNTGVAVMLSSRVSYWPRSPDLQVDSLPSEPLGNSWLTSNVLPLEHGCLQTYPFISVHQVIEHITWLTVKVWRYKVQSDAFGWVLCSEALGKEEQKRLLQPVARDRGQLIQHIKCWHCQVEPVKAVESRQRPHCFTLIAFRRTDLHQLQAKNPLAIPEVYKLWSWQSSETGFCRYSFFSVWSVFPSHLRNRGLCTHCVDTETSLWNSRPPCWELTKALIEDGFLGQS